MSEPTIASKLLGAVKSIFGRKDGAAPTTEEKDGTAPNAEETAAPATSTESTSPDAPAPAAAEEETQSPEPSPAPAVVDSAEKAEIAAELANNETPTVSADSSVFEEAKAAASAASAASTTGTAAPAADELPVPNYDTLTIASVRARLRKLTLAQVRQLRAYETAGANRADFVKMYDNRIAKLEAEGEA